MSSHRAFQIVLLSFVWLAGCNDASAKKAGTDELPAWLAEQPPTRAQAPTVEPLRQAAVLGLRLKPGDQFPLRKVVQQELRQDALNGLPRISQSRLELMFAITVQEQREGQTKLTVRYDRVKYQHDVADEHVEFDSTRPTAEIPTGVRAYHDMVNDGFSFWIGQDNQIVKVEGFTEFLNRCLRNVPPAEQQQVVLAMEAGSGETGLANFVDNTIGLLPYGRRTSPGDSWERQQTSMHPIPMYVNNVYTLKELTDQLAVIDIHGSITPSTNKNALDNGGGVQVTIDGGSTQGSCTIFRETGLPKESRVDRTVEMTASLDNVIQFHQTKRVTTTIESYPPVTSQPTILGWSQSEREQPAAPAGRVTPTGYQQTVTR